MGAGLAGFVEFFFLAHNIPGNMNGRVKILLQQSTLPFVSNHKNDASSEQREKCTFCILFPGSMRIGSADLVSFLAGSLKFLFKVDISISPLSVEPLHLFFAGFCKLDCFPWPGPGYPFYKYWPCGVLKWLRKGDDLQRHSQLCSLISPLDKMGVQGLLCWSTG